MYLQSRSSEINLEQSEDAQFNQEWRQPKTKMCDEDHMPVCRTEKHQNDVKASPKLQSFNYPYSPTFLDRRIGKSITNGYENVCHSGDNGSRDSSGDNNGPVSDNNHYVSCEFSSDIYENGGDSFRTHSEFDRSSVILERSDDFLSDNKHQLWTDNITGGTSRKEYIDMNLYRSTFQHDSSNSLQSARRIGFIENRSANTETQNLYQNEKRNDKTTNKTCLVVILGILLIACTAGVLAWFLAKKGDDEFPFKYYVAFETYKLESSIGSQVSVKCLARNTNSIKSILIRKIENSVNTTVANVTLPDKKLHVNGTTVSYTNNSLTLTFSSLTCSDDGQYMCIVIREDESQIESPANLHVQIKNPPKHEAVSFILHPDIKENKYDTSNVHTCRGDVGYPSGLGYLSLKFTDPTTNASFTYDKMTVTEDIKIALEPPLKFKVSLATGLSIIIVEDNEPDEINCTREKEIKFLLQSTRDWNKANIRCSVITEAGEVNSTSVEKQIYVIPDAICNGSNGSDVYVPHEKIDGCKSYVRCYKNVPTGQLCGHGDLCFDHQNNYCNWCADVSCESEMSPTAEYVVFETYKLESYIGSQVSMKCLAQSANSIKTILIQKIDSPVNHTVANVTLPDMTSHVNGTTVSYSNNSLTLTFTSLTCSDDGQYTCIVIKEDESQIESPEYLRVQIKNPPKHEEVAFILNPDIKENKYDTNNVHTCSGDVGYPSGLGYLSLKFTDPTTNASFTYDKMTVTEDMKIALDSPLKFKLSLSSGLSIIIVEDDEPDIVNCTRKKEIKFLLQATRDWNKAKIRCRVVSETNEVNFTSVEKDMYVIPDAVCDGSNGSDIYVPHEKIDQCRTYIRCFNYKPTGQICGPRLCFDHQKKYCDWCTAVACESEMSPTTEEQITTTYSTPVVPEIQCPLLSCKPTSVFEMETGNIVCVLNTSMSYDIITVMKNGQAIMTVYPNGTNYYYLDNIEKYESTVGTSFTFGIKNVSCSDKDEYTFTVDVGDGGRCSKAASLDIKTKPGKPTLVVDYSWTEGTNKGTHYCIGDVGNPPGTMTLEIKNGESGNFTSFSPSTQRSSNRMENCTYKAKLSFSIDFKTNNITGHYIRCVAASYQQTSGSPFYSDEIRISPLPENTCFEDGTKPYPGECTKYISCSNNITHVSQCGAGFCFSATTCIVLNCDNICTT